MGLEDFCLSSGMLKWEDLNYTVNISNKALKFHGQSSSSFFWRMTKGCSLFCFRQTESRLSWQMPMLLQARLVHHSPPVLGNRLKPQQCSRKGFMLWVPAPSLGRLATVQLPTCIRKLPPLQHPIFPLLHSRGIAGCYNFHHTRLKVTQFHHKQTLRRSMFLCSV